MTGGGARTSSETMKSSWIAKIIYTFIIAILNLVIRQKLS